MRTLFCNTKYGAGGIGQHFAQLVEESRHRGELDRYYATAPRANDDLGIPVSASTFGILRYTPIRWSPSWKSHINNEIFDRRVAAKLRESEPTSETVMGFVGKSLHSFREARKRGVEQLELVAVNSHVDTVARLHQAAEAASGIRDTWLNRTQQRKTRHEYEEADKIYVHSSFVRNSFLEAGVPSKKLVRSYLSPDPRFEPPVTRTLSSTFRIVYVGRVEMTKGLGILLDAFERLPIENARLTIVGGWSTRAVRKIVQNRCESDPRIVVEPGDPLPALQRGDVFVHPSYEDGFGYAPMEALACGTPVLVTEDTGMAEYVDEDVNGRVLPTGDVDALIDSLVALQHHPLASARPLFPDRYYQERRSLASPLA